MRLSPLNHQEIPYYFTRMKFGFAIYANHLETVWNPFSLDNFALEFGDSIRGFYGLNAMKQKIWCRSK
jgi:hypothetical protein